jgi:hypothetical protein
LKAAEMLRWYLRDFDTVELSKTGKDDSANAVQNALTLERLVARS